MDFVSSFLLKATVEFNSVNQVPIPHDNGAGEDLVWIFRKVGWDITVATGDTDVQELGGEFWSASEADTAPRRARRLGSAHRTSASRRLSRRTHSG